MHLFSSLNIMQFTLLNHVCATNRYSHCDLSSTSKITFSFLPYGMDLLDVLTKISLTDFTEY